MNYRKIMFLLSFCMLCGGTQMARAEKQKDKQKTEKAQQKQKQEKDKKKSGKKGGKKSRKGQPEPPADSTKVEKPQIDRPGLFRVTKEKDEWFFHVPDSLLGREILTTVRFTSTPSSIGIFGGEQVNEQTVRFEKAPNGQLLLRSVLFINVADSTQQISKAITISNTHPIIGSFKVEEHKDGVNKIKVSAFFNQDNPALGLPNQFKKSMELQGMIGEMSYIEDIKSFPMNTEVRTVKTYASNGSQVPAARETGKVTFGLNVSFVMLPADPMPIRYFDPRVGYFTNGYNEFTDDQQRVEAKRIAARWRLEARPEDVARQKAGEAVEPIKPIVYYIDPATPKQWRKYLIHGVEDWQPAFEKAGWKNAIQAREWPENDTTMSMEDARYSCIRYLASPIENAYGPHVSDPRTGEILESHICWYHNVMRLVHDWYLVQASSIDEAARKMNFDEDLMGQLIRFVSSHEVGHTLSLRHNFGSSSTVPVDSLRSKAWVEAHGHTPSIMDYARFNYVAQPEDGISRKGIFPRIGDYDIWAIQWGYMPMKADNPDEDHRLMEPLVREAQKNPRLWWGDGEGSRIDPRCQTEDLGDDAVKASNYGLMNLKREIVCLTEWAADDKKDIYDRDVAELYDNIIGQFYRYMGHVVNYIGGQYRTVRAKDEPGDVYAPNPLQKQKDAMEWIDKEVFHEPTWMIQVPYINRITSNPEVVTKNVAGRIAFSLKSRIYMLNKLYTVDTYLADITRRVFSEADSRTCVSNYRATLQNAIADMLIGIYNGESAECRAAALYNLQQLQKKAKAASTTAPDSKSRAHWALLYDNIGRTLTWK